MKRKAMLGKGVEERKRKKKNCFTFSISLGWEKVDPSIFSDFLAKLFAGILSFLCFDGVGCGGFVTNSEVKLLKY